MSLVQYSRYDGDLSDAMQEISSISDAYPENRVIVDGGMYVAACGNLKLDDSGFLGTLSLRYYEELNPKTTNSNLEPSLGQKLLRRIFRDNPPKEKDISLKEADICHENVTYRHSWSFEPRDFLGCPERNWIVMHGKVCHEVLSEFKAQLADKCSLLLTNDFLRFLYGPIFQALLSTHKVLMST